MASWLLVLIVTGDGLDGGASAMVAALGGQVGGVADACNWAPATPTSSGMLAALHCPAQSSEKERATVVLHQSRVTLARAGCTTTPEVTDARLRPPLKPKAVD